MKRRQFLQLMGGLPLLYALRSESQQARAPVRAGARPNFLIVVFDAFSAGHASLYGYPRETTPALARMAERATVYHAHYAAANFTSPGTSSLLSGTHPWTHRALHINGTMLDSMIDRNLFAAFDGSGYERSTYTHNSLVTLLFDQMRRHLDHDTPAGALALMDNELSDNLFPGDYAEASLSERSILPKDARVVPTSLFLSLFDSILRNANVEALRYNYRQLFPRGMPRANLQMRYFLLEDAINWLKQQVSRPRPQPYLMYVHLFPPHSPYNTRREFINRFAADGFTPVAKPRHYFGEAEQTQAALNRNRQQYDEYLPYVDAEFGRLSDFMREQGLLENTYLIFTSDHGESFERGINGHITEALYEPVIRVPLVIARPGQQQREDVHTPTSCVDLLPSLLHAAELPVPGWCEGRVLPGFGGPPAQTDRAVFAVEAKANPKRGPLAKATLAMRKGAHKLVYYTGYEGYSDQYELYDLENDPEELGNLYAPDSALSAELRDELRAKLEEVNRPFTSS